jgi:ubiquinone biosynthesis accessory factor UbiJ
MENRMIKPLLTRLLGHLINQNSWARPHLQPYAGKHIRLQLFPLSATLVVLEDGGLAMAGDTAIYDAGMRISPSLALRLLAKDASAHSDIVLEGDTEFAIALGKVLQAMSWDYEEDLSHVVGDVAASQISQRLQEGVAATRKQAVNLTEMAAEFWQEEQPLIAKKRHVEAFNRDVDTLRDDIGRLEKHIEKLSTRLDELLQKHV